MSKRGTWVPYQSFRGGQKSDLPAHLIPDDSMLLAENVITNKIGRAAKRGPVQQYLTSGVIANVEQIGLTKLTIGSAGPIGVGVSAYDQGWYSFSLPNTSSLRAGALSSKQLFNGTFRSINLTSSYSPVFGPSFNSFGLTGFPLQSDLITGGFQNITTPFVFFSTNADSSKAYSGTGICALTAGKNTITVPAAVTAVNPIGSFIYISKYAGIGTTTNEYIGYVTAVGSGTVDVYPAPTTTFTTASTGIVQTSPYQSIMRNQGAPSGNTTLVESGGGIVPQSSSFGCVHQNRVVLCTQAENSVDVAGTLNDYTKTRGNVISWSAITGESASSANTGADGILSMLQSGWPKGQRLTLDTAKVVALVSMDANNLMVLCSDKTLMISGTLGTVVPSAGVNTSSFTVRTIAADVGCVDADSVQRTPYGVMFASRNGVYLTDGTTFTNIMVNKIQGEWNIYQYDQSNAVCGSAVLNDTHYVLFTNKGPHFICDMTNDFAWTKMTTQPDIDGSYVISLDVATQSAYTKAATTYKTTARYFNGATGSNGMLISSVAAGGDLWTQSTTGTGATQTQITGVTTDTTTTARDIGVSDNATRVVIPTVSAGVCTVRVYTIAGSVATLEQTLTPPSGKTFSTDMRVDMNAAGDTVCVALTDGFVVYKRTFSSWAQELVDTSGGVNSYTVVVSGDGNTVAAIQNVAGGVWNTYKKVSGSWVSYTAPVDNNQTYTTIYGGNRMVSLSYDGTWLAAVGQCSVPSPTPNQRISVWKFSSGAWGTPIGWNGTSTTFRRYDAISIANNGYFAVNDYTNGPGFASYATLFYVAGNSSSTYEIRQLQTNFSSGTSGSGTAAIGWNADGLRFVVWRYTANSPSHVLNSSASTLTARSSSQSYGIGIRDLSGSNEVYAPRVGGISVTTRLDAIVLLDSILQTDSAITTASPLFNQLVDAGTISAFNATIETKSYTFGEPASLKVYKSLLFVYDADPRVSSVNPVNIYSSQGLEPQFDFSTTAPLSIPATPSHNPFVSSTVNTRFSIYPRQIDNGVAFGFQTAYTSADSTTGYGRFQLYELSINAAELRKGRTFQ